MHKSKNILIKIIQTIHSILTSNYRMNNNISSKINKYILNINIINNNKISKFFYFIKSFEALIIGIQYFLKVSYFMNDYLFLHIIKL